MRIWIIGLAMIAVLAGVAQAQAAIVNGGFESGFAGWTNTSGSFTVVTAADGKAPTEGLYFAKLPASLDTYTLLSQSFTAFAGDTLTFDVYFKALDSMPYNDDGYVALSGVGGGKTTLFAASVSSVGDYGSTPWTQRSYTFSSAGTYTIEAGVENKIDTAGDSYLGLDNVKLTSSSTVPEPATLLVWSLLGGLGISIGWWRRKRAA